MKGAASSLHKLHKVDDNIVIGIPVGVDGTCQKRYGNNALLGVSFLVSIDNGCVLDYSIKSKSCHVCRSNQNASYEWKERHKDVCAINHHSSSGAMERDGVVETFLRLLEKHNLKYTDYIGDGDTNSFGAVIEELKKRFGESYKVNKQDCIGHIQKRMGSALRNYKNSCKGSLLPVNKSVGEIGRLTDKIVDKIQTYYGYAIRNNIGDIDATIKAIWAIFFHMILGPPYESKKQQHSYCPVGRDTWCGFNRNENNYKQTNCLKFFLEANLSQYLNVFRQKIC